MLCSFWGIPPTEVHMTDFLREMKKVNRWDWAAGHWEFSAHSSGNVDLFYRTRRMGCFGNLDQAKVWAKAHWRNVEKLTVEQLDKVVPDDTQARKADWLRVAHSKASKLESVPADVRVMLDKLITDSEVK